MKINTFVFILIFAELPLFAHKQLYRDHLGFVNFCCNLFPSDCAFALASWQEDCFELHALSNEKILGNNSQNLSGHSIAEMTLEEKIGQLFIIPACETEGQEHWDELRRLITYNKVGGILLKKGTVQGQREFIASLQQLSSIPLLCLQDGEWGVSMRLSDAISLPRHMTLGAIQNLSLLYQFGQEVGRQCKLVGAHIVLGPVVDVNCNLYNPIIHQRSFGEDPVQVAERGIQVMRGIQSMGVIACAKHFLGHGDTTIDSHVDLPIIPFSWQRLQRIELYPFQKLIDGGVGAIMSAHLYVTALTEEPRLPVTFSSLILTSILKEQMGFQGLLISDALNMKALANHYSPDRVAIKALQAGHDLLLYGDHIAPNIAQILRVDVPLAIAAIKIAVEKSEIPEELIDAKVRKIMQAKEKCGLFATRLNPPSNIKEKINSPEAFALKKKLFEEAVTVVCNQNILPLKKENTKLAFINWGESPHFQAILEQDFQTDVFSLDNSEFTLGDYSCIIISLSKYSSTPPHFGLDHEKKLRLQALSKLGIPCIAVVFGTPYSLADLPLFEAIVIGYENERESQEAAANILLGKLTPKGRLPVSVPHFPAGTGLDIPN